ncbi:carbon-nitrogen hydrolase family protein [Erythrobacter rubeus]|uniref:Carbon-nitrogen hydrolase family protein n=1 Tax=Erythrobacter rubeus TaxID=2760803 RepID=A0ABR8KRB4_9SPHN|nr:carbon-nitrogen hydrolase family protein [Erythrobacter rubeus]MBD2842100.1 carbon-nitrogen hydrolase family protein [Erythrobacter rubeus]
MTKATIAALQIGSHPERKAATLDKILSYEREIAGADLDLLVLPEAVLGGYPKGSDFGTRLGYRLPEGRDAFAKYYGNAVDLDGPEVGALADLAKRCGTTIVAGVIERGGNSLFCTALFITPEEGLVAKHRKLMPTGSERLVWGLGDGSTMPVIDTPFGRIGAAICWENHMPLFRTAMYAKGVDIWCAPTVDHRDVWRSSMRHIAHEGRCFLVSACQYQPSPAALGVEADGWGEDRDLIAGGSMIAGPLGDVLAGSVAAEEGLITSEIDTADLAKARYDFDVVGHYSRPDIFQLNVDETARPGVRFSDRDTEDAPED